MNTGAMPSGVYPRIPKRTPSSLGFARYTLRFDGVDDYIGNIGALPTFSFIQNTGIFSIETRVRILDPDANDFVVFAGNTFTSHEKGFFFSFDNRAPAMRHLRMHIARGMHEVLVINSFSPQNIITDTAWHHIVVTGNGTNVTFCVNDMDYAGTGTMGTFSTGDSTRGLNITKHPNWITLGNIPIIIDGIRIYNQALSAEERRWNMLNYHNPIRSGLRLWLPMEEGAGEVVYDKSGHGNHGTLLPTGAGPTWERLRQWELRSAVE